jgi:hypothetical protein
VPAALGEAPDPRHPAFAFAVAVAAVCVAISVSFVLYETDMWQHFVVGRVIWQTHSVPTHQLWTWPTYGAPDVNSSWGFRLLIWPVWRWLGVPGLFAWRWLSTLAVFAFLWQAARRMGARGFAPLVVMVLCSLVYRQRSHIRPETLVSVLLAVQLWIHESWRARVRDAPGGAAPGAALPADHRAWLVLIAWLWANAHISYWMGLAVQGIYLIAEWPPRNAPVAPRLERAGLTGWRAPLAILAASVAVSLVNPWGWRALWQPFEYFLYWRHEDIFKTIAELTPVDWHFNQRNLLPEFLVGGAVLLLWRSRTRGVDRVEWLMLALFVPLALMTQRFLGFLAVATAPYVARDLDEWVRSRGGWRSRAWIEATATALLCVSLALPEWLRPTMPLGIGIDWRSVPVRAADFLMEHGVRGRGFNQFAAGGYLCDRFWPDRSRLPFMDIHQAGTREDRYYYAWAQQDSTAWRILDRKYRFDYAVLFTRQAHSERLLDLLGADSTHWALVLSDDAGSLFLRRDGPFAALADSLRYRVLPAGNAALIPTLVAASSDSALRRRLGAEFERAVNASPWNTRARMGLVVLADEEDREDDALRMIEQVLKENPLAVQAHEFRADIEYARGDARGALAELKRELRIQIENADLDVKFGRAYLRLGQRAQARHWYQRALKLTPGHPAARDSLASLDRLEGRR